LGWLPRRDSQKIIVADNAAIAAPAAAMAAHQADF
jgi:hypothetical protein